jgi:diguanylate cyclase (GGDEF)-like protein/PAS domain S-box-containing protein
LQSAGKERKNLASAGQFEDSLNLNLPENSGSARQQEILDALPVLVFLEREGRVVFANAEARQMLGAAEGSWTPRPVEDVLWGLFPGTAEPRTALIGTEKSSPFHATLPIRNGRLVSVEGTYSLLNAERQEAIIVAQPSVRELAPKSRLMEDVLASIPEAVAIVHGDHVLYTNPAFTQMFGYTSDEASGGNLRELIVPETRQHEHGMLEKEVDQHGTATIETVRTNKVGELLDVAILAGPLTVSGATAGYVLSFRDISERKETEAKLQHDALHDVLTGLPNRALFLDRLTLGLSRRARRRDQSCAVLFLDLDHFKEINDSLGHAAGDALLIAVAERLCASIRPQDSASRLGGDEFAILLENILDASDLNVVATRLLREMERPFEIFGQFIQSGASIGAAMAGPDHTSPDMLIRDADFAMYRAKQNGGARFEIFDTNLEVHVTSQQERERELRQVLADRHFEVWYQPIYRLQSGKLEGFESLLRWRRPDGSVDSFSDLLSVAEDTGLSITLGRETMDSVFHQVKMWSDDLPHQNLMVTVNVTHRQFYHPDLVSQLKRALAAHAVDPSRLVFEIAETTLNENLDAAIAIIQRMVDCDIRVAVDNFGSNLAPLNHLVRLPIDIVKMARKLTTAANTSGRQQVLLESLIHLGHRLGMQMIAQGIETQAQLEGLCRMGCQLGQGHLLSYPLESVNATRLVEQGIWAEAPGA